MAKFNKSDLKYWRKRLFRLAYLADGDRREVGHYSVRIQHKGIREVFPLYSSNSEAAAIKAREIHSVIVGSGWETALAKYKPESSPKIVATVGEFLQAIKETATGRAKTLEQYAVRFRQIVAESFGIDDAGEYDKRNKRHKMGRFDYRGGGRQKWLEKVNAVKLSDVTPEVIQRWKVSFLKRAGNDPLRQRTARVNVNSALRQAESLFSEKHMQFVNLDGISNPFAGIKLEAGRDMRYRSTFDIERLVADALKELPIEQLKAFLLAGMAGLRRAEIDHLRWNAFDWGKSVLVLSATNTFAGKSEASLAEIDLDPELVALFRGWHADIKDDNEFVLRSDVRPRPGALYNHYRCNHTFKGLLEWLRKKGVSGNAPIHTLRKEFGSEVNKRYGIYAASRALRHASVGITASVYTDKRQRTTVGLGHLLTTPSNVVQVQPEELQKPEPRAARSQ
jgi:integrase